ncbi:MAG TPA: hypothetical protein VFG37_05780, partial [Planctomycetota bacterium]|nr:hypothetical protein [Planctomycetota bacterium]
MRKRAWAAALLVAGSAALGGITWWFLAARDARDESEHRPAAPAPVRGDAPVAAESAAAAASATRTENRDLAAPSPAANRGADAFASGATNWDQASKTSGIELEVLDATTRERLRDVVVEQGGENFEGATSRAPPGGGPHALEIAWETDRAPVARGDSPLRIQLPGAMRRARVRWLIGAPGFATVARWFDVTLTGWRRHVVVLAPGGALEVVVRGDGSRQIGKVELFDGARVARKLASAQELPRGSEPRLAALAADAERAVVQLRRLGADGSFAFEFGPESSSAERRIEGLSCGDWLALVSYGTKDGLPQHLVGRARVDGRGAPPRLEFDLAAVPPPPYAPFTGTVRFAAGWSDGELAAARNLLFTALDLDAEWRFFGDFDAPLEPTAEEHVLRFAAGWHRAGRHSARIPGLPAVFAVDVAGVARGPPDVNAAAEMPAAPPIELFVDEPAAVVVRVADAAGAAPPDLALLRFVGGPPDRRHDDAFARIATQVDGSARLPRVPRGAFHVEI